MEALKAFPIINAEIQQDEIVYKNYYNIGVAVGTEKGLVVPVVRDADELSFADIYTDFYDGNINTGDYFFTDISLNSGRIVFANDSFGNPNIVFTASQPWIINGTESFIIPSSTLNYKSYTLLYPGTSSYLIDPSTGASFSGVYPYVINKSVATEDLGVVSRAWEATSRNYLEMSLDSSDELTAFNKDTTLS